ncbi:MAG: hypothetical protein ACW96X_13205 [Promethearchaeota archaeon]|jgi:hypothetical protein
MKIPKKILVDVSDDYYYDVFFKDIGKKNGYIESENDWIVVNVNNKETDFLMQLMRIANQDALDSNYYKTAITPKQLKGLSIFLCDLFENNSDLFEA